MKITKPDIIGELTVVEDLLPFTYQAQNEEEDITRLHIKNVCIQKEDLSTLCFNQAIFENCKLIECDFEKGEFVDVIFKGCDLSNCNFTDGYFNRIEFTGCKSLGANFYNASFKQLSIANCNFKYANFDKCHFDTSHISMSDFNDCILQACKLKTFSLDEVMLNKSVMFNTPLKGIDFTLCQIDGIVISESNAELSGAIVSPMQAVDLSRLLGLKIKN